MKQISFFIAIVFFVVSGFAQQPTWQWAKQTIGQAWEYDMAYCTQVSDEGSIYIAGIIDSDTCYFDTVLLNNFGLYNSFVAKLSPNGGVMWIRSLHTAMSRFNSICLDSYENIYVAGNVYGCFNFANNTLCGNWNDDILLLKYDSNGNEIWAKVIGDNSGADIAFGVTCDIDDNIIVSGRLNSVSVAIDSSIYLYSDPNIYNGFIIKYDINGNVIWATKPNGNTWIDDICTDLNKDIYITGFFSDTIYFDLITINDTSFGWHSYLTKYNSQGNAIWVKQFIGFCRSEKVETDLDNNIYVTGRFESQTLILDSIVLQKQGISLSDMFIAKYDKDGNILWARNAGGTTNSGYVKGKSLTSDKYGNIYLTGDYLYQMMIDTVFAPYVNGYGIYTIKYNNIGDIIWIENTAAPSQNEVFDSALDNDNNLVICGFFIADSISFGEHTLYNYSDGGNIFVAKLHDTIHAPITSQEIAIEQGWQMISTYVEPFEPNTDSVFSTNSTLVTIMKDDIGSVYYPQWNINAIGEITEGEGYSINANTNFTLEISGTQILPEFTQLNLNSGWSMIAYLRETPAAVESMLISISSNLILVKSSDGTTYWPMYGINYIGNMQPGEGYLIKMNLPTTLTYPAN